jgi:hypothetical protein
MSTTLGILTALVLTVSAFLGYKNLEKYKEQIVTRQEEESKRDNVLRPKLKKTLEERDDTKAKKEAQQKLAEEKGVEVVNQQKKIDDLKVEIAAKEDQVRTQQQSIDALKEQLKNLGNVDELVTKLKRMVQELAQLETDIASTTIKLNNLISEKNRTAGVMQSYDDENNWRNANLSNPKLATRINSIFDTYGFVTLPVGNNAGVVGGSSLEVVRDGEVIAKLLVKTVEAGTAAAEIVPDSLRADTVLMVGDSVRAAAPVVKPAPAPAKVAPAPLDPTAGAAPVPAEPAAEPAAVAPAETPAAPAEAPAAPVEEDPFK